MPPPERVYARRDDARGHPGGRQGRLKLARLLREVGFDEVAARLEGAWDAETRVLALSIEDRERIIRALDDPPAGPAELRGVLLVEHEWRVREGLV